MKIKKKQTRHLPWKFEDLRIEDYCFEYIRKVEFCYFAGKKKLVQKKKNIVNVIIYAVFCDVLKFVFISTFNWSFEIDFVLKQKSVCLSSAFIIGNLNSIYFTKFLFFRLFFLSFFLWLYILTVQKTRSLLWRTKESLATSWKLVSQLQKRDLFPETLTSIMIGIFYFSFKTCENCEYFHIKIFWWVCF